MPRSALRNSALPPVIGLACLILGLFCSELAMFWPGVFSYDTGWQWGQAQKNIYSDHHPPVMAWVWHWLGHVLPAKAALLIFHGAMFWAGIYVLARAFAKHSWWYALPFVLVWFTPPVMSMTSVLWKDTGMTCAYLLTYALIQSQLFRREPMKPYMIAITAILLLYGTAVRYNAFFALPPLCILWAMAMTRKRHPRHIIILAMILFAATTAYAMLLNRALTDKRMESTQQLLLVQLAGMSHITNEPQIPIGFFERRHILPGRFYTTVDFTYDYTHTHPFIGSSKEEVAELRNALFSAIREHPRAYAEYSLQMFRHLMRWNLPESFSAFQPAEGNGVLGRVAFRYFQMTEHSAWFRPWIYLLTSCAMVAIGVYLLRTQHLLALPILLLNASGICYVLPYLLIAPGADFRYVYWLVITTILSITLCFISIIRQRITNN